MSMLIYAVYKEWGVGCYWMEKAKWTVSVKQLPVWYIIAELGIVTNNKALIYLALKTLSWASVIDCPLLHTYSSLTVTISFVINFLSWRSIVLSADSVLPIYFLFLDSCFGSSSLFFNGTVSRDKFNFWASVKKSVPTFCMTVYGLCRLCVQCLRLTVFTIPASQLMYSQRQSINPPPLKNWTKN